MSFGKGIKLAVLVAASAALVKVLIDDSKNKVNTDKTVEAKEEQ